MQNPGAKHSLGVAILTRCKIRFEGSLGYFGCGLIDGPEIEITGRVGWSACENMMSGVVTVRGNAGSLTGAAIRGGDLIVHGRLGARSGIDQKGGLILTLGDVGSMTGFMMQRGRQIICGNAGPGLGDSMYDGIIYVGGKVKALGIDCVPGEWTDADTEYIERKFRIHNLGTPPTLRQVRVREDALQLRRARAERAEAGALVMADETTNSQENILGQSRIFTPAVMNDIHVKSELGRYRMRGFSMFKPIPHWDELMFMPGTLTRFVIEGYREKCVTKTVLGARFAKKPIELDIPVYITGMSFGALSIEAKMALAKGASMAGSATCSGEGGMIPPERDLSTKWYYQCIQSRYGFNPHHLMLADACEFFIGQGCKVGLGGHLMGQKVTEQVAEMRSLPAGIDQRSPARHPDWLGPDDLSLKIQEIREATNYEIPIQLKLGASRVYDDVRMAAKCGPDIIYLDGAEGGTGAGPHIATEETGIPLMAAIPEARRALEDVGLADEIDLVVAGGIRNGGDVAKAIALGAKAVAIGHSALMALNCNKEIPGVTDYEGTIGVKAGHCYHCHTGRCPVGHHDAGRRAAQAPEGRRGRRARLQLPAHAHARGADARARVRQDEHPQPRARGPVRADDRGRRDGEGARSPARTTSPASPSSARSTRSRRCSSGSPITCSTRRSPSPASTPRRTDRHGTARATPTPARAPRSTPSRSRASASPTRRTGASSRTSTCSRRRRAAT